jgi:hypothetical protein
MQNSVPPMNHFRWHSPGNYSAVRNHVLQSWSCCYGYASSNAKAWSIGHGGRRDARSGPSTSSGQARRDQRSEYRLRNVDLRLRSADVRLALWNFASGEPAAGGIPQGGGSEINALRKYPSSCPNRISHIPHQAFEYFVLRIYRTRGRGSSSPVWCFLIGPSPLGQVSPHWA